MSTLKEFRKKEVRNLPDATGELSNLLRDITLAAKRINAALQYEAPQKWEAYAHEQLITVLQHSISCAGVASQEMDNYIAFDDNLSNQSKYVCVFDPLDGSSNITHRTLNDEALSKAIQQKIRGFENEKEFFIQKLSFGIAKIAAAFYPETVIVRFSDFKSNEYRNLLGGEHFEPHEENPMIGWRGASRYYSKNYKAAFGLECKAIQKVREEMGLMNVAVMIPFCRTVKELVRVKATMAEFGLWQHKEDLQLYLMAELPSNIIMAKEFAEHIDGFSIGSNDLTQLTLGLDRDSSLVAHLYDERDEAVKRMLAMLITSAKEAGVKVGICGQGPSDHSDFAQFLVEQGIDSISVTPDSVIKTIKAIHAIEQNIKQDQLIPA